MCNPQKILQKIQVPNIYFQILNPKKVFVHVHPLPLIAPSGKIAALPYEGHRPLM